MQLGHLQKSLDLAEALGFLETQKKASTLALLQSPWLEEEGAEYNKKDRLNRHLVGLSSDFYMFHPFLTHIYTKYVDHIGFLMLLDFPSLMAWPGLCLSVCWGCLYPPRSLEGVPRRAKQRTGRMEEDQAGRKKESFIFGWASWDILGYQNFEFQVFVDIETWVSFLLVSPEMFKNCRTKQACSDFETSRSKEISENAAATTAAETTASTLKGEVADAKQSLLQTQTTLKDDRFWDSTN